MYSYSLVYISFGILWSAVEMRESCFDQQNKTPLARGPDTVVIASIWWACTFSMGGSLAGKVCVVWPSFFLQRIICDKLST